MWTGFLERSSAELVGILASLVRRVFAFREWMDTLATLVHLSASRSGMLRSAGQIRYKSGPCYDGELFPFLSIHCVYFKHLLYHLLIGLMLMKFNNTIWLKFYRFK